VSKNLCGQQQIPEAVFLIQKIENQCFKSILFAKKRNHNLNMPCNYSRNVRFTFGSQKFQARKANFAPLFYPGAEGQGLVFRAQ
jgi:hypothetical protein